MPASRRATLLSLSLLLSTGGLHGTASAAAATTYEVSAAGSGYKAESDTGTVYTGTLKVVVEKAAVELSASGGGTVKFGPGDYNLGDKWLELDHVHHVAFVGAGMDATVLRNNSSANTDTEPFDVVDTVGMSVRDMTVSAGGPLRSTSDALDFDSGNGVVVENVKVIASRGRGIVFDGKGFDEDFDWKSEGNRISGCVISGLPGDGIELLASSGNRVENCQITQVGGHGIQLVKSSSRAPQPYKKSSDNVLAGNRIDEAGLDGVNISGGDRSQVLGNRVTNSGNAASGHSGIRLSASDGITTEDTLVKGNTATDTQATKTQVYGLDIAAADVRRTVVDTNDFAGNKTAPMRDRGTGTVIVTSSDTQAPTAPSGLTASATSVTQVDLAWSASTDNVGVTGYRVYRDGTRLVDLSGSARSYTDTSVAAASTYTYTVDAVDAAGNRSASSSPATVTTPSGGGGGTGTLTLVAAADAYVTSDNTSRNYGTSTTLRVDASPVQRSYLRFDGVPSGVLSAKLRLFANTSSSTGHEVRSTSGDWQESTVTYASAPQVGAVVATSGAISSGQYSEVDVTAAVTTASVSLATTGTSSTGISYGSRESTAPPQLVVVYGSDSQAPTPPTSVTASAPTAAQVDITWADATDDVGVTGYGVYRDGVRLTSLGGDANSFSDTTVSAGTTYTYAVDAVDAVGNRSDLSAPASVTTPLAGGTLTVTAAADSYVSSDNPTRNYGALSALRVDASPEQRAYLRFDVPAMSTPIQSAKLRLYANTSSSTGHSVRFVESATSSPSWTESTISYDNAPAAGPVFASSGAFTSGRYIEVDVTGLVRSGEQLTLATTGSSSTGISYGSRESSTPPQLLVTR